MLSLHLCSGCRHYSAGSPRTDDGRGDGPYHPNTRSADGGDGRNCRGTSACDERSLGWLSLAPSLFCRHARWRRTALSVCPRRSASWTRTQYRSCCGHRLLTCCGGRRSHCRGEVGRNDYAGCDQRKQQRHSVSGVRRQQQPDLRTGRLRRWRSCISLGGGHGPSALFRGG